MSVRLVRSGRWNLPVGIHGQGAHPLPDDAEEVDDLLTDILLKSATDPGPDPRGGGGNGSGGPPAAITGATASATGFTTGTGVGMVTLATLACATGGNSLSHRGCWHQRGWDGWRR